MTSVLFAAMRAGRHATLVAVLMLTGCGGERRSVPSPDAASTIFAELAYVIDRTGGHHSDQFGASDCLNTVVNRGCRLTIQTSCRVSSPYSPWSSNDWSEITVPLAKLDIDSLQAHRDFDDGDNLVVELATLGDEITKVAKNRAAAAPVAVETLTIGPDALANEQSQRLLDLLKRAATECQPR